MTNSELYTDGPCPSGDLGVQDPAADVAEKAIAEHTLPTAWPEAEVQKAREERRVRMIEEALASPEQPKAVAPPPRVHIAIGNR